MTNNSARRNAYPSLSVTTLWTHVPDAFSPERIPPMQRTINLHCTLAGAQLAPAIESRIRDPQYDVVSCQMAIHYAMRDKQTATAAFDAIEESCRPGGVCVVSTTDAQRIIERFDEQSLRPEAKWHCSVQLVDVDEWPRSSPFGAKMRFKLRDRVDDEVRVGEVPSMTPSHRTRKLPVYLNKAWDRLIKYSARG